jgi:hypothetical protein
VLRFVYIEPVASARTFIVRCTSYGCGKFRLLLTGLGTTTGYEFALGDMIRFYLTNPEPSLKSDVRLSRRFPAHILNLRTLPFNGEPAA